MPFVNPDIQQAGTVSDRVTTATSPETITFANPSVNLAVKAITALRLKINDETNWHTFDAGETFNYGNIVISKLVIENSGSEIDYKGGHV